MKIEGENAVVIGKNERGTSMGFSKSAVICIDDSSDEESANVGPKVEKMDEGVDGSGQLQSNSESLTDLTEESQQGQMIREMPSGSNSINLREFDQLENVSTEMGKQKPPKKMSIDKTTLLKSRAISMEPKRVGKLNRKLSSKSMRTSAGKRSHRCDVCLKSFSFSSQLEHHRVVHVRHYRFHCVGCARGFEKEAEKVMHDKICQRRRFECHICQEFSTRGKADLKIHMIKHTGEKAFSCDVCFTYFGTKRSLRSHFSSDIHHQNVNDNRNN